MRRKEGGGAVSAHEIHIALVRSPDEADADSKPAPRGLREESAVGSARAPNCAPGLPVDDRRGTLARTDEKGAVSRESLPHKTVDRTDLRAVVRGPDRRRPASGCGVTAKRLDEHRSVGARRDPAEHARVVDGADDRAGREPEHHEPYRREAL